MQLRYLGHSCFEIVHKNNKILIDPFLALVPNYNPEGVTHIFVTHGHGDHLGNAIEISKQTGASITAVFELANYCSSKGVSAQGISLGAWIDFPFGKVIAVPAFHSSSTPDGVYAGCPCGFVFNIDGKILYHAGDTCLNSEMKIIGDLYEPDISCLPVGGCYTMDIEHAVIASEWLKTSMVIPMHYNTFEAIKIDITDFERQIREKGKMPMIMSVGEFLGG